MAKVSIDLAGMTPVMQNNIFIGAVMALQYIEVSQYYEVVTIGMKDRITISGKVVLVDVVDIGKSQKERFEGNFEFWVGEPSKSGVPLDTYICKQIRSCIQETLAKRISALEERIGRLKTIRV